MLENTLKFLILLLVLVCMPSAIRAGDESLIVVTYPFEASSPPWLEGLSVAVGEGTDFNAIPCLKAGPGTCELHPTESLEWGGLLWFVQSFHGGGDHDCIYYGEELAILAAPLPHDLSKVAVFMVIQEHRVEECDQWGQEHYWKYKATDLDGDGVTELCVEELRKQRGTRPHHENWAHAQKRTVRAYRVEAFTGLIQPVSPELAATCPEVGYAPFANNTERWSAR